MDEAAVFEQVVDGLEHRGYDALVHVPGAHSDRYSTVLDRCDSHRISIAGRYPDVLGFTQTNHVFAIEVKGDTDLLKGLGQALTYQRGSHAAYLAAGDPAVSRVADIATAKGLGVIGADTSGIERWIAPSGPEAHAQVADVAGQLTYQLRQQTSAGKIATASLAQPLNFLAPVVALARDGPSDPDALADTIEDEYDFHATADALRGARVIGLVDYGERYSLTDVGELAATTLRGYGVETLTDLVQVKQDTRGTVIADEHPPLATLLRTLYTAHPEVRLLVEALGEVGPTVQFPDLLRTLVQQYPNVFLNLFCTQRGRDRARELIERGDAERLYTEEAVWKDVVRANVLFNFVQQLKHIGLLAPETKNHGSALSEYDPAEKPWIIRKG